MPRPEDLPDEEALLAGYDPDTVRETAEETEKREKAIAEARRLERRYISELMQNESFRRWLMRHLTAFNTFGNTFAYGPSGFPDPLATWWASGRKSAGWDLWEEIDDLAPDLASLMRREGVTGAEVARER